MTTVDIIINGLLAALLAAICYGVAATIGDYMGIMPKELSLIQALLMGIIAMVTPYIVAILRKKLKQ